MPIEWIHHPWNAPKSVLEGAGVELGVNYPKPLVDVDVARERLDEAVAMMWELDRAERASKVNGSDEVVEDNLLTVKVLDIPKVVLKKEMSVDALSLDQRVPSVKGSKELYGKRLIGEEINDQQEKVIKTSKLDEEDLLSTAESSSSRKRSFIDSQCAVPSSCFSSSQELDSFMPYDPIRAIESCSVHLWPEPDGSGLQKVLKFYIFSLTDFPIRICVILS